jgi:hypothetical protein
MKKTRFLLIPLLALALALPIAASAFEARSDVSVYIAQDETIDGNLYASGQTITAR